MMRGTLALLVSVLLIPHVVATQTNASRFAASQGSVESVRIPVEEASIAGLQAAYSSRRTTARAVTQAHLDRINAYDKRGPLINALITVNLHALEEADRLDALRKPPANSPGRLHALLALFK